MVGTVGEYVGKWFPVRQPIMPPGLGGRIVPVYRCDFEEWRQRRERLVDLLERIMYGGENSATRHDTWVGIMDLLEPAIDAEIIESWTAWGWQPAESSSSSSMSGLS